MYMSVYLQRCKFPCNMDRLRSCGPPSLTPGHRYLPLLEFLTIQVEVHQSWLLPLARNLTLHYIVSVLKRIMEECWGGRRQARVNLPNMLPWRVGCTSWHWYSSSPCHQSVQEETFKFVVDDNLNLKVAFSHLQVSSSTFFHPIFFCVSFKLAVYPLARKCCTQAEEP